MARFRIRSWESGSQPVACCSFRLQNKHCMLDPGYILELDPGYILELDPGYMLELDLGCMLELDLGCMPELDSGCRLDPGQGMSFERWSKE